jgi:transcriptional regulator with XRE-family HTH domain
VDREPFGTRLRSLRERARMTQAELAAKIGSDQSIISRWERNLAEPELTVVERLATALGVYAVELLIGPRPNPSGRGRTPGASDKPAPGKWHEAQERVLIEEYRVTTGKIALSVEEAERWFAGLPFAERDRIGRRLNDPGIIGRHLETPRIH